MENDTFYFTVKLIWRFSGNLIYHVFSIEKPVEINYIISPYHVENTNFQC